jgi:hypothetical protein
VDYLLQPIPCAPITPDLVAEACHSD